MTDLITVLAFIAMVLSPCVVAMGTGVHDGADLGRRDPADPVYGNRDGR